MDMRKVYSYLRFSNVKQARGSSIDRQLEYARRWAAEHGLTLDESLTMRDEGLSAFHQKHVKTGALGVFLDAVTNGNIPTGSVLIVEGLDRLSRAEPVEAQAQLTRIINAGITVVTVADGKQYNRESMRSNPMDLIYSLLVMIRAHEESETKSKRVSSAVKRQAEGWVAGTYRGRVLGGVDVSWVTWNGTKFELVPDIAAAVREAIALYISGWGPVKILQHFHDKGITITGASRAANISSLLTKCPHRFIGRRVLTTHGKTYVMDGYYPALLSNEEYARLLEAIANRRQSKRLAGGKSSFPSLFTGLSLTFCGHCGDRIVSCNSIRQMQSGPSVYRWFRCPRCALSAAKSRLHNSTACSGSAHIEEAFLNYCSDQLNLDDLLAPSEQTAQLRSERANLALQIADNEQNVAKIVEAAMAMPSLPQALLSRATELEVSTAQLKDRLQQVDDLLAGATDVDEAATATQWAELKEGVLALDYEARMRCRHMIASSFRRIQFFFSGATPDCPNTAMDMLLISKSGVARMLRIDRKTGRLLKGLNKPTHQLPASLVSQ